MWQPLPPCLEVKAQHYKSSVGSLLPQQQESLTWAESQLQQRNPALFPWTQIPRRILGEDGHVSLTPLVTSKKAGITRRTLVTAFWLGWWSTTLRIAPLALVHVTGGTALLPGTAVLSSASFTLSRTTPCELWRDACVMHQRTIFLSSRTSNLLTIVSKEPRCF